MNATAVAGWPVAARWRAEGGPLLVATDGTTQSDAALRMARLLSDRSGAPVHVIGVVATVAATIHAGLTPSPPLTLDAMALGAMAESVARQIADVVGDDADWEVEIVPGDPPDTIVRTAAELGAALIVLGLGRHGLVDKLLGTETAVQVMRRSRVPVLAVPPDCEALPRRAVVAMDFSELSIAAARAAMGVVEDDAALHLVYVNAGTDEVIDPETDDRRMERSWDHVLRRIDAPTGIRVRTLTLSGAPGRELLAFARAKPADLIVAGTHGRGVVQRLVLGSVAAQLIRGAHSAVLVAPAADASA